MALRETEEEKERVIVGTASHEAAAGGGTFRTPVAAIDAIVVSLSLSLAMGFLRNQ